MSRPYYGKPRTLKQRWSFERNYSFWGSLAGIRTRLSQIAKSSSILPVERLLLAEAWTKIGDALYSMKAEGNKEESWEKFKKLEGGK